MAFVYDRDKSARNVAERGLPFDLVGELDWHTALLRVDARRDYGEVRIQVWAMMKGRLYAPVVTTRGSDLRVVSFRKANNREVKAYEETKR